MEQLLLIVHVLIAVAIIAFVLLQQGKGAEAGASFGAGASQTVFGSSGGGNFFTKVTTVLATLFFVTSFGLAVIAKDKAAVSTGAGIPQTPAAASEVPVDEDAMPVEPPAANDDTTPPAGDLPPANDAPAGSDLPPAQ